jgi:hypothetical protein
MNISTLPFGGSFHNFTDEVCKIMGQRGTFNSEWFNSQEGQKRMMQTFHEGLGMNLVISELEVWASGFRVRKNREEKSAKQLAKQYIEA